MNAGMFDLIHHCYAAKSMLAEIYVHPNEEGYIGDAENWEYANRFIQPCYAPTWSEATTEECNWTPITPTVKTDFSWAGYRGTDQKGTADN
eukprot:CAMPEP_0172182688 /NCGR_PEP_ID=MMETSP1050-20130122/18539_1 /TAXON_ID=233186 /ORGANISM="Cryptomonas curvata, Strain CCAP979/52" /LENGTH=90 /DNA_ID=CAMNT_0012856163 /DNA_START=67 /DNA_END=339 /DNA_ORIENTATION=-